MGGSRELESDESLVLCSWLHLDYQPRGRASFSEMYAACLSCRRTSA